MVKFKLNIGKWLNITGENLKGKDLAIVLVFLLIFVMLVMVAVVTIP